MRKAAKSVWIPILFFVCVTTLPSSGDGGRSPSTESASAKKRPYDLKETLRRSFDAYERLREYECMHYRRHRLNDEMTKMQKCLFKFRRPFSVRFKVLESRKSGIDVLYVKGKNDGKIRVRPSGLASLITVNLDPKSERAMQGELYPITKIGIGNILDMARGLVRKLAEAGELEWSSGDSETRGLKTRRFEVRGPVDGRGKYFCYRAVVHIDPKTALPVHVLVYDWDNRLREEYLYLDLDTSPGFKDEVFSFEHF